jgi:hypothetical protein
MEQMSNLPIMGKSPTTEELMAKGYLSRETRLQIMLHPDELAAVDKFRFSNEMPSRAAAVRELFRLGLANVTTAGAVRGKQSRKYGVLADNEKDNKTTNRKKQSK